jgi:hypothetical protein
MGGVPDIGNAAHNFINGQLQAPVTIKGFVTTTALVGTHTVINPAFVAGSQVVVTPKSWTQKCLCLF